MTETLSDLSADEITDPVGAPGIWTVLVVQPSEETQIATRIALSSLRVDGRPVAVMTARNAHDARVCMVSRPNLAAVLLDLRLDEGSNGLDLARWIREELGNSAVRIIVRTEHDETGAAAVDAIREYDVNDVRDARDLNADALRVLMTGALRNWRDIQTSDAQRAGLARVVEAATTFLSVDAPFFETLVSRTAALFGADTSVAVLTPQDGGMNAPLHVSHATGRLARANGSVMPALVEETRAAVDQALVFGGLAEAPGTLAFGFIGRTARCVLLVEGGNQHDDTTRGLFALIGGVAALAFERHLATLASYALADVYEGLVPRSLIELAQPGCSDARRLQPGTRGTTEAAIVAVHYGNAGGDLAQLCVVEGLLRDILEGRGGVVVQQTDTRMVVVFTDGAGAATDAAVAAVEGLEALNLRNMARCAVALGLVTVMTLGEAQPRGLLAVGTPIEQALTLIRRSADVDVRVLVTEDVRALLRPTVAERLVEVQTGRHVLVGIPLEAPTTPRHPAFE